MAKNELFTLVKSLSKSEKRYFKTAMKQRNTLGSSRKGDKKLKAEKGSLDYMDLYELLLNSKEEEVLKVWKDKKQKTINHTNLTSLKSYLYKNVLRNLRNFNEGNDAEINIQNLIFEARILERKRLFKQALKQIKKAEKMAQNAQCLYMLIEVLNYRKRLAFIFQDKTIRSELKLLQERISEVQKKLIIENEIRGIYEQCFLLTKQSDFSIEALDLLFDELHDYKKGIESDDLYTVNAQLSYSGFMNLYYLKKEKFEEKKEQLSKTLDIYDSNETFRRENFDRYLGAINNYASNCANLEVPDVKELENISNRLKLIKAKNLKQKIRLAEYQIYVDLLYFLSIQNYSKVLGLGEKFEKELGKVTKEITPTRLLMFYFNFAQASYFEKKEKIALSWIQKVFQVRPKGLRFDIRIRARVMECLINYDEKVSRVFEYLLDSTIRFFKRQKNNDARILELLSDLKKIVSSPSEANSILEKVKDKNELVKEWEELDFWLKQRKI